MRGGAAAVQFERQEPQADYPSRIAWPLPHVWVRRLRDHCADAGVPFFFKQWGAHLPCGQMAAAGKIWSNGSNHSLLTTKAFAGRFLDSVQHDGMPNA